MAEDYDATNYISFDFETELMGPGNLAPKPICISVSRVDDEKMDGSLISAVYGNGDEEFWDVVEHLLFCTEHLVGQNVKFDLSVIAAHRPDLIPAIFQALEDGRVHDTMIREKLLNLSTHGKLVQVDLPDGSTRRLGYSLADLVSNYLGEDRSSDKKDEDAWRMNYAMLDGLSADAYPDEAVRYSIQDAEDTLLVFFGQEERGQEDPGPASFGTETFHVGVDFALNMMSCWGVVVDPVERAKVEAMIREELGGDALGLLIKSGILVPGKPPRPYKNGAKNPDGTPKMTAGKKEKVDSKKLRKLVGDLCKTLGMEVPQTKSGQISASSEVIQELSPHSPILAQYALRQSLQKLVSTELPRIADADMTTPVHPTFDVLKETGRTSCFAGGKGDWPSANIQNVDSRIRSCYAAREGTVILSTDYNSLELCTLAEKLMKLFGKSRLADLINEGKDAHAYLGSRLAYFLDPDFKESCQEEGFKSDEEIYEAFLSLKKSDIPECRDFFKHYRTFAKPTGLGYPGGLGPATFVTYAKATYGIEVTEEQAKQLREIWFQAYPEMKDYFDWIQTHCQDPYNPQSFAYTSPLGMYRAGASFCATANGAALQTPAAEGAKLAVFNTVRACYDKTIGSCLYGTHPIWFIHDEIGVEIPEDEHMHERAYALVDIMVDAMSQIIRHVKIGAEPALMRRWSKKAEPVFDQDGRLTIWDDQKED